MKVPVILLNYNSSADCCKCVADLKRQEGVELEIIIVDNCSRKEDASAVEQLAAEQGCTFIAAKENRGYNAGNSKQSFRAVLCTLIYISTFVPNLNFGQDEHKRRRQVLCLNGSQVPKFLLTLHHDCDMKSYR